MTDDELALAARRQMKEAAARYALGGLGIEGGIVTGYVGIFEVTVPGRKGVVVWITGDGSEPNGDFAEGIMEHRIEGLLRHVQRDLDCHHRRLWEEEDG